MERSRVSIRQFKVRAIIHRGGMHYQMRRHRDGNPGGKQTEVPEAGFGCCARPLTQLRIFPVPTGALPGLLEQYRPIAMLQ
jgi:hypothetical protein